MRLEPIPALRDSGLQHLNHVNLAAIRSRVDADGFAVMPVGGPLVASAVADMLGKVRESRSISFIEGSQRFIHGNGPVPFHNEDPDISLLAWYCASPADRGGETLLLDGKVLAQSLPQSLRRSLETTHCPHRNPLGRPVISTNGDWYYIPWSIPTNADQAALIALRESIDSITPFTILLKAGDLLIIDNRRMLHGRTAFFGETRSLTRFLID